MTLPIDRGRVEVRKPGSSSVTTTIPGGDISSIDITQRIQEWKDDSSISYYNDGGKYTKAITSGDKLSVILSVHANAQRSRDNGRLGEIRFGESTYGGQFLPISHSWRGWARSPTYTEEGADHVTAEVEASDFVFEVLSARSWVFDEYTNRQIAGTEDSIVNELLRLHAPEVDRDMIEPVTREISFSVNGDDLLTVMQTLAARGDALLASKGDSLIFRPVEQIQPAFKLTDEDYGTSKLENDDQGLKNAVRIDGAETPGEDQITAEGRADVRTYQHVSDEDRLTYKLSPEKNSLMYMDVWTNSLSDDNLRVRIQRGNETDTGPIAPDDDRKDIDSGSTGIAVSDEGWRHNIRLSKEILPENPWLIIDSNGSDGHEIGMVDEDTPAIRTYYPHRIVRTLPDIQSQRQYRRREIILDKEDVATNYQIATDIAETYLKKNKLPKKTLTLDAQSVRMHTLTPGQVIQVDKPELDAVGPFIATERSDDYDGDADLLRTDMTFRELKSL